jgi:hypothetical protein
VKIRLIFAIKIIWSSLRVRGCLFGEKQGCRDEGNCATQQVLVDTHGYFADDRADALEKLGCSLCFPVALSSLRSRVYARLPYALEIPFQVMK